MARLPTPGGDDNNWGTILNDFLSQSHDGGGKLTPGAVAKALVSASAPSTPSLNDLWYDQSNELLKRWNGSVWRAVGSSTYLTSAAADTAYEPAGLSADTKRTLAPKNAMLSTWFMNGENADSLVSELDFDRASAQAQGGLPASNYAVRTSTNILSLNAGTSSSPPYVMSTAIPTLYPTNDATHNPLGLTPAIFIDYTLTSLDGNQKAKLSGIGAFSEADVQDPNGIRWIQFAPDAYNSPGTSTSAPTTLVLCDYSSTKGTDLSAASGFPGIVTVAGGMFIATYTVAIRLA